MKRRAVAQCRRYFASETNNYPLPQGEPPKPPLRLSPDFASNQEPELENKALADELHQILQSFHAPVRHALAYGSGVYKQANYSKQVRHCARFRKV
jgi:hypothetical protein